MGDYLTKPVTEKNATDGKNALYAYGACSMQGWRQSNEDAHIHELDIGDGNSLFAVFDGHGGEQVALFCEKHFVSVLINMPSYKDKQYEQALQETFVEMDYLLLSDEGHDLMKEIVIAEKKKAQGPNAKLDISEEREIKALSFNAGCTACVVLITKDTIYCANAGDSRACIWTKNNKVVELSHDHKPDNDGEMKRVKAGGGFVEEGRVQGIIAVSRAIGDWEYKNPSLLTEMQKKKRQSLKKSSTMKKEESKNEESKKSYPGAGKIYRNIEESKKHQVTAYPDVIKVPIKPEYDFLINACDGIWDCYTNEEACTLAYKTKKKGPKPLKIKKRASEKYSNPGGNSPLKIDAKAALGQKMQGETSFMVEKLMDQGIAKGDISMSDGTGTDNMTCIIVRFLQNETEAPGCGKSPGLKKEESKK